MLFRGIKHQVDKGPVDWVTGKAKYTLNDNRLLREDLEYRTLVRAAEVLLGRGTAGSGLRSLIQFQAPRACRPHLPTLHLVPSSVSSWNYPRADGSISSWSPIA